MATFRSFSDMLNEYLTNSLLMEEFLQRSYLFDKMEKDQGWKGGNLPVPFLGQYASSVAFGALTPSNDIAQYNYVRGSIPTYKELWGTMIFNHSDLQEHNGKIPETTFLRILPDQIDSFMNYCKEVTSANLTTGPHFARVTDASNANLGEFIVDKIDRFTLGQKVALFSDTQGETDAYVIQIVLDSFQVTVSLTRGGPAANLSAYVTGDHPKFYHPGAHDSSFISMRSAFLSFANGGSATLHGQNKLAYPHLQAINVDGTTITQSNILDKIFDGYTRIRQAARGNASTILMSFKHLGSVMKQIQLEKGAFSVVKQPDASQYGWTEIEITSVKGTLTIVGIQEMDDDVIFYVDWTSFKFVSNGLFKKRISPDGLEYFEIRNTTGYQYISDVSLWGEMMYMKPSSNGVLFGINYT